MRGFVGAILAVLLSASGSAASDLKDENLLVTLPEGYKPVFSDRKNGLLISEMVPSGQTLEDWQEMLTVQVHFSRRMQMTALEAQYTQTGFPMCEDYEGYVVRTGRENGYEFGLFLSSCTTTPASHSETIMTKVILGNDSTYFIVKSWRMEPSENDIVTWSRYMSGVKVCDSRIAERACPSGVN